MTGSIFYPPNAKSKSSNSFIFDIIGHWFSIGGSSLPAMPRFACIASQAGNGRVMFYTYVLRSQKDKKLYIGWTSDLKSRLKKHNEGLVTATKYRKPLELLYYEACKSKEKAIIREKQLKTGFGRAYLKKRLGI